MKKLLSLILVMAMVLLLCACGKADDYEAAIALMEAGNYEEAIVAFTELGDYEDSPQKLEECKNIMSYNDATALFEAEKFEEALVIFSSLGTYKDSADRAKDCENAIAYEDAIALLSAGEYEQAYKVLCELGDYKDVAELLSHFVEIDITPENWNNYFCVVEEPEFIKNDFNEIIEIYLDYNLCLNENVAERIYNPDDSKVIFELDLLWSAKDIEFDKITGEYSIDDSVYLSDSGNEIQTFTWFPKIVTIYQYKGDKVFGPATPNGECPTALPLLNGVEVIRSQGSIFIYE